MSLRADGDAIESRSDPRAFGIDVRHGFTGFDLSGDGIPGFKIRGSLDAEDIIRFATCNSELEQSTVQHSGGKSDVAGAAAGSDCEDSHRAGYCTISIRNDSGVITGGSEGDI
jgi:hypothetical protein